MTPTGRRVPAEIKVIQSCDPVEEQEDRVPQRGVADRVSPVISDRVGLLRADVRNATDDMMSLRSLVAKSAEADLLREVIGLAAETLVTLQVGAKTGSGYGEENRFCPAQRDGYRDRVRETRAGTAQLRNPKLRTGSYIPRFLEPWRMAESPPQQ